MESQPVASTPPSQPIVFTQPANTGTNSNALSNAIYPQRCAPERSLSLFVHNEIFDWSRREDSPPFVMTLKRITAEGGFLLSGLVGLVELGVRGIQAWTVGNKLSVRIAFLVAKLWKDPQQARIDYMRAYEFSNNAADLSLQGVGQNFVSVGANFVPKSNHVKTVGDVKYALEGKADQFLEKVLQKMDPILVVGLILTISQKNPDLLFSGIPAAFSGLRESSRDIARSYKIDLKNMSPAEKASFAECLCENLDLVAVPETYAEDPIFREYTCALSKKPISKIKIVEDRNGGFVYFDERPILEFLDKNPGKIPPGWPEGVPVSKDKLEDCNGMQQNINNRKRAYLAPVYEK